MAACEQKTGLGVISWNINGLNKTLKDMNKGKKIMEIFERFDVVLLQETHLGTSGKNKEKVIVLEDQRVMNFINSFLDSEDEEQGESDNEDNEGREGGEEEEEMDIGEGVQMNGYTNEILQDHSCSEPGFSLESKIYMTYVNSRSRGVAILVNKQHNCLKAYCEGGDFAWVYIDIGGQRYTFVSVYHHQKETSGLMLRILYSFLIHQPEAWTQSRLVIGGDFNTTLNPGLDLVRERNPGHNARRKQLMKFMNIVRLADVFREKNQAEIKYTYSCNNPKSRLDYLFMLQRDLQFVQHCDIPAGETGFGDLSDHYPVVLTLTAQ